MILRDFHLHVNITLSQRSSCLLPSSFHTERGVIVILINESFDGCFQRAPLHQSVASTRNIQHSFSRHTGTRMNEISGARHSSFQLPIAGKTQLRRPCSINGTEKLTSISIFPATVRREKPDIRLRGKMYEEPANVETFLLRRWLNQSGVERKVINREAGISTSI